MGTFFYEPTIQFQTYVEKYPAIAKRLLLTNQQFLDYQKGLEQLQVAQAPPIPAAMPMGVVV